ncbi:glycoside hydrolase family 16 protein [Annulohypoxylon truncatum]|uniref:glycoside hydrolase family 16 protein n=1 Tax=Annulohypoxylon truncatum TaxID=327061 RepID=UPI0020075079|nr:glycoside hydrolase family 16 protein [Annulohypoxylon truncatum]KAI1208094.1 glycoside hydrolase family 16 protein [Annulohypoxylon truncatum]
MSFTKIIGGALALGAAAQAAYTIQDSYDTTNFFDGFDFFNEPDPTNGFVNYVSASEANALSLAGYANGGIYLGVDANTTNPPNGRSSVRISSKKTYSQGLIIADIAHQPAAVCGSWPAFWTVGPNWPAGGEIDIIEGVNMATNTTYTLHTSADCTFSQGDCNAPGTGSNGCPTLSNDVQTLADGFNAIGGGIFALEWTSSAINIFFFPRTGSIPQDIAAGSPDPSTWGSPQTSFSGSGCDIPSHFTDNQIVFDTTFCGDWAGKVWPYDPICSTKAATCQDYVAANPTAFKDSYWLINSVKVYSDATNGTATTRRRFHA